jgi:hypothetical protein
MEVRYELDLITVADEINNLMSVVVTWGEINRNLMVSNHLFSIQNNTESTNQYWFNEQASLSALAGAIWQNGGLVVQEYSAMKKKNFLADEDNSGMGRIDFYFTLNNEQYICEAKQEWLALPHRATCKNFTNEIESVMEKAANDIKAVSSLDEHSDKKCFALSFLTPYWSSPENSQKPEPKHQTEALKKQLKELDALMVAYLTCEIDNPLFKKNEAFNSIIMIIH